MLVTSNFIVMPAALLMAVVAKPLIVLFLTEKWLPSVLVFQCLCLANCILMFQIVNLRAYMAVGESGLYLKLQVIKVAIGIVILSSTALITHDIYAVAFATIVFSFIAIIGIDMQPAKRVLEYGRMQQLKDGFPHVCLSVLAVLVVWPISLLGLSYLLQLILQIIVFCGVYLGGAFIFKIEGLKECQDIIKQIFGRKSNDENDIE